MQDLNVLLDRIHISLKKLQESNLPEIERDILLEDLRVLYALLKETNTVVEKVAPKIIEKAEQAVPAVVISQKEEEPIEVVAETEQLTPAVVKTKQEEIVPEVKKELPETNTAVPLNEIFSSKTTSLNEKFVPTEVKKALNDYATSKDLKTLIDFNKQIAITKELFNNDAAAFSEAISKINASNDIQQAFDFVSKELMVQYKWDKESQTVRLFDKLLRQKFGLS